MKDRSKKALDALANRNNGRLTPRGVVAAARPARSPLHPEFTWDDRKCGELWREDEARHLIRSYEVVVTTTPFVVKVPMYVRDPDAAPEQGYVSTGRLRTDEDLAHEVLIQEFERIVGCLRRVKAIAHYVGLKAEIDNLNKQVDMIVGRAQQASA